MPTAPCRDIGRHHQPLRAVRSRTPGGMPSPIGKITSAAGKVKRKMIRTGEFPELSFA